MSERQKTKWRRGREGALAGAIKICIGPRHAGRHKGSNGRKRVMKLRYYYRGGKGRTYSEALRVARAADRTAVTQRDVADAA